MPRLSIVIPTKNEEHTLPALFQSIQTQTMTDYELIVSDAQSKDRTREIAAKHGARVVEGGMPGPGRNRGAEYAQAEYIVFFDADVILPRPRFLEACLAEMSSRGLDIATCKPKPISRRPVDVALHEAYNTYVQLMEKIKPHAGGYCIFVRRKTHKSIHGFDESVVLCEDQDYVQRAKNTGYRFGILHSCPISVSVRRLEKDGRLAIALKYIFLEWRLITKGSIKELPFEYIMGGDPPIPPRV